jgi:hypothetical protein
MKSVTIRPAPARRKSQTGPVRGQLVLQIRPNDEPA